MKMLFGSIVAIAIIGCLIAIYEWGTKRTLLKHDLKEKPSAQTEADRELNRTTAAMRDRTMFGRML